MTAAVSFELADRVGVLRLDDGKANAIGYDELNAIDAAIDAAESQARALMIIGREGCFSAGFDLRVVQSGPDASRDLVAAGARTAMRLYSARLPVVAACTGHALAFGAIMLMSSDVRIGADIDAKIGLNEVSIGLPLPVFAVELARDRLSPAYFTQSTTLAGVYTPREAQQAGYLDELSPQDDLTEVALSRARALAAYLNPAAFAQTRRNTRQATVEHVLATLDDDLRDFGFRS